jgi:predicted DNA-binding protein
MKQRTDKTGSYYIRKIRKKLTQMEDDLESCIDAIDESIEKSRRERRDHNDVSVEALRSIYESDLKIIREAREPDIKILKQIIVKWTPSVRQRIG